MSDFGIRFFAQRDPQAPAIIDGWGKQWSRGELLDLIDRTTGALAAAHLQPGDAIAIVAPNSGEYLAAHLAGIAAGLYVVPINWHLADPEIAFMLDNCAARAVIADSRLGAQRLAVLASACSGIRLAIAIGGAPQFLSFGDFAAATQSVAPSRPPGRVLAYTSATTGIPKAVRLPLAGARAAVAKTVAWQRSLGIAAEHGNVHLCSSMLYHVAPLNGAVTALEMGHTLVLMNGWDVESFLRTIDERRITTAFMVPTMFVRLLKLPAAARRRYSTASLRLVVHSAAPCPPDIKRRMLEWWGPVIYESYGASEVQGCIASPAEWLERPGTVGRPIAGSRLKIVGDDGRELEPGEIGTVYLTPHTGDRFEYLGDPVKTAAAHRGDFVTVGDRGYVDEAGYLFLVGRESELIISSGMNIYPAEIEQVLLAHPAVIDCAVIGAPHALCGEVPEAHVQLAPGTVPTPNLTATLLHFLGERLSPMKLPRRIAYDAALPRDPSGKLLRRQLMTRDAQHER